MAKLLAIDLDGTLFYPKCIKRCICKKNVKFLRRWIDAGNKLVLVTSRSTQFTERLKDEIKRPVDFITCCSSQIIADDKLIYNKAIFSDDKNLNFGLHFRNFKSYVSVLRTPTYTTT